MGNEVLGTKKYISWAGIVKSIGIYLVFLGHVWYQSDLPLINTAIYSFHMPMFFIISGYVYRSKDSFSGLFKKKLFRLLLPALFYNLITSPLFFAEHSFSEIKEYIYSLVYFKGEVAVSLPCWFFIILFFIFMLSKLLRVDKNKWYVNLVISAALFGIGFVNYTFIPETSDYFGIRKLFLAFGFFTLGKVLQSFDFEKNISGNRVLAIIATLFFGPVWYISGVIFNTKTSFYHAQFGNYFLFMLSGISGTIFISCLVAFLISFKPINAVLSKIENYPVKGSVLLVCTHYPYMIIYMGFMVKEGYDRSILFNILTPFIVAVIILLYYPLYKYCSKKLPFLVGEYKFKK